MRFALVALLVAPLAACGAHVHPGNSGPDAGSGGDSGTALQCDPSAGNACQGNDVVTCNPDGTYGSVVQTCGNGMACTGGTCNTSCTADGVDLVYVVDEQNDFMSFDPRKLLANPPSDPFTKIGTLTCPTNGQSIQTGGTSAIPFSMSVDRDGVAWVLYTTGEIFQVSLTTAACTKANNTIGASGMNLFGMGFVTDAAGGMTEKLYLAGGGHAAEPMGQLAYDDTHGGNLTPVVVGQLTAQSDYSPELTGTNEAKLYGFYPEVTTNAPAYVQEVDKASGAPIGMKWNLGSGPLDTVRDWAFAQWGGIFWVFVTTQDAGGNLNSTVRSIDRTTGTYNIALQNLPYNIDGAGVSTCAPVVIQ